MRIGAMVGARGCLMPVMPPQQNALADVYVVVVWQGVEARAEPSAASRPAVAPARSNFGQGLRRGVSVRVMVPDLQKGA